MTEEVQLIPTDIVDPDVAEKQTYNPEKGKILFDAMKRLGITALQVNFDGAGDSGSIQDIYYNGLHQNSVDLKNMRTDGVTIEIANGSVSDGKGNWVKQIETKSPQNMYELIEEISYEILSDANYNWCNNDGGFGDLYFFTEPDGSEHVRIDMNTRYSTSENHPIVVVV